MKKHRQSQMFTFRFFCFVVIQSCPPIILINIQYFNKEIKYVNKYAIFFLFNYANTLNILWCTKNIFNIYFYFYMCYIFNIIFRVWNSRFLIRIRINVVFFISKFNFYFVKYGYIMKFRYINSILTLNILVFTELTKNKNKTKILINLKIFQNIYKP